MRGGDRALSIVLRPSAWVLGSVNAFRPGSSQGVRFRLAVVCCTKAMNLRCRFCSAFNWYLVVSATAKAFSSRYPDASKHHRVGILQ